MRQHLSDLEQILLYAIVRLDDDAYGGSIRKLVEERTGRLLSPGAIYVTLERLESRQFITSTLGEPTAARGGKRKRFYRLAPAGARALRETQAALDQMSRGLRARLGAR
jgi:DNA-binding PadR family transcriptional regulator